MTDEGWLLTIGLQSAGYHLWGHGFDNNLTDVEQIVQLASPDVVAVQDKREWEGLTGDRDARRAPERSKDCFTRIDVLRSRNDLFKVTVLKDSHQQNHYHRASAEEMGCHAWIVYYHPRIVRHLAPYVRPTHLIRTHHCVDGEAIPDYCKYERKSCLLSGAIGAVYPIRQALLKKLATIPELEYWPHPGYHAHGPDTSRYLQLLSQYRAAICTSSIYGYAIRKIYEATACGCVVITDLPRDDCLPVIDENLIRISPGTDNLCVTIRNLIKWIDCNYCPVRQHALAERCKEYYDWRAVGNRLAADVEELRKGYSSDVDR